MPVLILLVRQILILILIDDDPQVKHPFFRDSDGSFSLQAAAASTKCPSSLGFHR